MTIAGILATPEDTFSQSNNGNNIAVLDLSNSVNLDNYKKIINNRDKYISQLDSTYMNPNDYFVYNKKRMFEY